MAINNGRIRVLRSSTKGTYPIYAGQPFFVKNGDGNIDGTLFVSPSDTTSDKLKGINVSTVDKGIYSGDTYMPTSTLLRDNVYVNNSWSANHTEKGLILAGSSNGYNGSSDVELSNYYVDRTTEQTIKGKKTFENDFETLSKSIINGVVFDAVKGTDGDTTEKTTVSNLDNIYSTDVLDINGIFRVGQSDKKVMPIINSAIDIGQASNGLFKDFYLSGKIEDAEGKSRDVIDITQAIHSTTSTALSDVLGNSRLITRDAVYYALPKLNGDKKYTSNSTFYAPVSQISESDSKMYLVGAKDSDKLDTVYSNTKVYAQSGKVYSNGDEVVTLSDTQTLTNKTLTTPVIASIKNGSATITMPTTTGTIALKSTTTTANTNSLNFVTYDAQGIITGVKDTAFIKNININNTTYPVFGDTNTNGCTIYAPTAGGTEGQVLISTGSTNTPVWRGAGETTYLTVSNVVLNTSTLNGDKDVLIRGSEDSTVYYGNTSGKKFTFNASTGEVKATKFNGLATNASRLSNTSAIGSATRPVYFNANGVPVAGDYTLGNACTKTAGNASGNVPLNGAALSTTDNTIIGTNTSGSLKSLGSFGNSSTPIYLHSGVPTAVTSYYVGATDSTKWQIVIDSSNNLLFKFNGATQAALTSSGEFKIKKLNIVSSF